MSIPLIGAIPDDERVVIGTNQGEPVIGMDSKAGKSYENICRRITGEEVPFMDITEGGGLLSILSHLFKKD